MGPERYVVKWGRFYLDRSGGWSAFQKYAKADSRSGALDTLQDLRNNTPHQRANLEVRYLGHRTFRLVRLVPKKVPSQDVDMSKALYLSRVLALWEESGRETFADFLGGALPCGYRTMTDKQIMDSMVANVDLFKKNGR